MRLLLIHFHCIGQIFLETLEEEGHQVILASAPDYYQKDKPGINELLTNRGSKLFNIDNYNYRHQSSSPRSYAHQLCNSKILQLLLQSKRLSGLSNLSDSDRITLIRDHFATCLNLLLSDSIEGVVFGGVPHSCVDHVMMLAANHLALQCLVFMDQPFFPGSSFCYDSTLKLVPGYYMYSHIPGYTNHFRWLKKICIKVVQNYEITGSFDMFKPDHDQGKQGWSSLYSKRQETNLEYCSSSGKEYYEQWAGASIPFPSTQIASIMLHCEPEATINPSIDEYFLNQLELATHMRSLIPVEISLGIKEHPGMFSCYPDEDTAYIREHRSTYFQQKLTTMPNTFLIDPTASMTDVINHSTIVICSSGTAGIESLLSKKIVIGNRLSCLNGVPGFINALDYHHPSDSNSQSLLKTITSNEIVSRMCLNCVPGSPAGQYNLLYKPNNLKNEFNMATSIAAALKTT